MLQPPAECSHTNADKVGKFRVAHRTQGKLLRPQLGVRPGDRSGEEGVPERRRLHRHDGYRFNAASFMSMALIRSLSHWDRPLYIWMDHSSRLRQMVTSFEG
jgi:hypothetical protein